MSCPICAGPVRKVIYYGLPLRLCEDEECSCLFGFWFWLVEHLPFNGWMMVYEGAYGPALWHWLTVPNDDDDEEDEW
jgi:hypothetical protein